VSGDFLFRFITVPLTLVFYYSPLLDDLGNEKFRLKEKHATKSQ